MADTEVSGSSGGIFEHEGLLWKPKATATADEFVKARDLFLTLHTESRWNPWVLDDRADDLDAAMAVMEQWQRGEPGHRYLTNRQFESRQPEWDRKYEMKCAAENERQARDRQRHDPELEMSRLALLEQRSKLAYKGEELAALSSGETFPMMDSAKRSVRVQDLESNVAALEGEVDRLSKLVGDPELVVDAFGRRPSDRRATMLVQFRVDRIARLRALRGKQARLSVAARAAS